jgi:alpha-methylacyl-CoA racemase|nr:MAG: carnitine dehydratase [Actinomycetota bacterium]
MGPLEGVTVVELAGIGPAPFCGMVLADLGARVVRVDRPGTGGPGAYTDLLNRGKLSIAVDLKHPDGVGVVLDLVERADALLEGFRPGVTERLGLGPDVCLERNPRLVYGRMTGWGQDGPLAERAGHDIDYIALSGVLGSIGTAADPVPPLNLVGDFGGGGMLLAVGVLAGILSARATGKGQVVDAAMVDGSALLMAFQHGLRAAGFWSPKREDNMLDGAAPWYTTYRTADGGHMAVGAIEPQFYAELLRVLGLEGEDLPHQHDRSGWPALRARFAEVFASRTRAEWEEAFSGSDACVAPVLDMAEAPSHPHNAARGTFVEVEGVVQPAPAPRFSGTPVGAPAPPSAPGRDTDLILALLGRTEQDIGKLRSSGAVA